MNFGDALSHLKGEPGMRVRRAGWNGKGMWITLSPGNPEFPAENFFAPANKRFAETQGGFAHVLPVLSMKTADEKILPGWLASQSDMLAEDWELVED